MHFSDKGIAYFNVPVDGDDSWEDSDIGSDTLSESESIWKNSLTDQKVDEIDQKEIHWS